MSYLIIPLALEFLEQQEVAVVEEQIFEELRLVVEKLLVEEQLFVEQQQVLEQLAEKQQLAVVVEQTSVELGQTVVG